MRRLTGLFLLAILATTQSGWLNYVHLREHLACGGQGGLRSASHPSLRVPLESDSHDESTCAICATLHMPMSAAGSVPLLICLGVLVAFLTQLASQPFTPHTLAWIESRGPPLA